MASPLPSPNSSGPRKEREFEALLATLFRQHGWRVKREPLLDGKTADLSVARGDQRYVIEIKCASEGRPDRLVPLLSQAILQARAYAQASPESAAPLAVVAAPARHAARRRRRIQDAAHRPRLSGSPANGTEIGLAGLAVQDARLSLRCREPAMSITSQTVLDSVFAGYLDQEKSVPDNEALREMAAKSNMSVAAVKDAFAAKWRAAGNLDDPFGRNPEDDED